MDLIDQIEAARRNLLDLTMRNRLLNFRPNKKRSIRVVNELPNEVYDLLVINEKTMEFKHKSVEDELTFKEEGDEVDQADSKKDEGFIEESIIWQLPTDVNGNQNIYRDKYLQTSLDSEVLQKRLFYINQQAHSVFEEQGYSVLFLALSFLEWKESPDSSEFRKAPLILVPVELERIGVQKSFRIKWTSEDVFSNISLIEKLKEIGISLPSFQMPEEKSGMEEYLEEVVSAIQKMKGWRLLNDIYLDFFSFTKFVMYKDLDPQLWPSEAMLVDQSLLKAVLEPDSNSSGNIGFSPGEMDQKLVMKDLYHVMDADPYQVAVLEDIKSGSNLVVEGPPGTGKSQTITNAIAELLVSGKTILFVSEKMAALEVVKDRLDHVGLGQYCLEIHSRKASKKDVLKELQRSVEYPVQQISFPNNSLEEIEYLRKELNNYARVLREPFGKFNRSPYALFQIKESADRVFSASGQTMPRVAWENIGEFGISEWNQALVTLEELNVIATTVKPIRKHPWFGSMPGLVLPSDEEEILSQIQKCLESIASFKVSFEECINELGLKKYNSPRKIEQVIQAGMLIAKSIPIEKQVLRNSDWDKPNKYAKSLIDQIVDYQLKIVNILRRFKEKSLEEDVQELLSQYKNQSENYFRFFTLKWWRLVKKVKLLYVNKAPRKSQELISNLAQLSEAIKKRAEIRQHNETAKALFGSHWKNEKSKVNDLLKFMEWILEFRSFVNKGIVDEKSFEVISLPYNRRKLEDIVINTSDSLKTFSESRDDLFKRVGINCNAIFSVDELDLEIKQYENRLKLLYNSIGTLQRWSQYIDHREKVRMTIAAPLIDILENDQIISENLVACFKGNYADNLLREVFKEYPNLGTFIGDIHERKIKRFQELDRSIIQQNRYRLNEKLHKNKPQILGGASRGSEVGILLGEFGRKRGHLPIRKLMAHCGNLIQKIKPCFMMSPLSIAQFLDPKTVKFDVILFDEASQVKPEDALGSLLRGSQLVVMGDTRQLPPTSFFDNVVSGSDEDDQEFSEVNVAEVESILHQCKRSFPCKLLSWHYRSKHESLIAVSNREFYDNKLLIFPSAFDKLESLGLQFVHLPKAVYDRGRSSVNRIEAREVAKAVMEHYRKYPDKSLGVGAFNIKQQQAILEEIELQLIEHREMEDYLHSNQFEHFFVKNLETIQGDERDVIFISLGFGFDENRKLSLNFGPLNQVGGERRLNVLITRAREKCVVFSNFRAIDLSLESNSSPGLRALKIFLAFAEDRTFPKDELLPEDADSPFEESVYEFLRAQGYEVKKQVGCASFRIDLAILDPKYPGRYLVGVECDGQKYHSSPVSRDRDRLRQQTLEKLGWKILRIWSTDWYRNRSDASTRLLKSLEDLIKVPDSRIMPYKQEPIDSKITESLEIDQPLVENKQSINNLFKIQDLVQIYECCKSLSVFPKSGELHRQSMNKLSIAVVDVVNVESPVHESEVIKRIRALWGLSRTGERIQYAIEGGIKYAIKNGLVKRKKGFLFKPETQTIIPRHREVEPLPNIDLICEEEIIEGILLVLKNQFSTVFPELIIQTCRVFGIHVTHEYSAKRIEKVINKLLEAGQLEKMSNQMLKIKSKI